MDATPEKPWDIDAAMIEALNFTPLSLDLSPGDVAICGGKKFLCIGNKVHGRGLRHISPIIARE